MILPPDLGQPAQPYTVPRGTCPRCGSAEVRHVIFGLPAVDADAGLPDWVGFGGCVIVGHPTNRYCPGCELEWMADPGTGAVFLPDWRVCKEVLGVASNQEFADWLYDGRELDFHVEQFPDDIDPDGELEIRVFTIGSTISFPTTLHDFHETLDDLEAEAVQMLEADE